MLHGRKAVECHSLISPFAFTIVQNGNQANILFQYMKYVLDILIQKLPLNKDVTTNVTNVNVNKDVTLIFLCFYTVLQNHWEMKHMVNKNF